MEALITLSVVIVVILAGYVAPWIRCPREKGLRPVIESNCSLNTSVYGFNSHGLPAASRISVYDDFFVISNFKKLILSMSDIEELHLDKKILSSDRITIKLRGNAEINISSRKSQKIYEQLKKLEVQN